MDFAVPEELTALRSSYAAFLDREVRPLDESLRAELDSPTPDRERLSPQVMCSVAFACGLSWRSWSSISFL